MLLLAKMLINFLFLFGKGNGTRAQFVSFFNFYHIQKLNIRWMQNYCRFSQRSRRKSVIIENSFNKYIQGGRKATPYLVMLMHHWGITFRPPCTQSLKAHKAKTTKYKK